MLPKLIAQDKTGKRAQQWPKRFYMELDEAKALIAYDCSGFLFDFTSEAAVGQDYTRRVANIATRALVIAKEKPLGEEERLLGRREVRRDLEL